VIAGGALEGSRGWARVKSGFVFPILDVFTLGQGVATLLFNRDGVLIKVRIEKESYQRKKKLSKEN
jgi:hypothetical protein